MNRREKGEISSSKSKGKSFFMWKGHGVVLVYV